MATANNPSTDRFDDMLRAALGSAILQVLDDPRVVEVMANADGQVWIDRAGEGRSRIGSIEASRAESVIRLVADHVGEAVGRHRPLLSGTLPHTGQRFQGQLPPVTERPVFCIRKRAELIFTLDDYVRQGIMTATQARTIRDAADRRDNLLIAGGTGSGKTTLANAVLAEAAFAGDRLVLIEDTRELQCSSPDRVELLTKPTDPPVTMEELVRCALRCARSDYRGRSARWRSVRAAEGMEHGTSGWTGNPSRQQRRRCTVSAGRFDRRGLASRSAPGHRSHDRNNRIHPPHARGPAHRVHQQSHRIRWKRIPHRSH